LRSKPKRDALLRLNGDHQTVRLQSSHRRVAEEAKRGAPELNRDLSNPPGQVLASAQIERNIGAAPVIDEKLHGDKRFGRGIRLYVGLGAICRHLFAVKDAGVVLSPY